MLTNMERSGLHELMRGAVEGLDPLVSQITFGLDSSSLIVSAAMRRAGGEKKGPGRQPPGHL